MYIKYNSVKFEADLANYNVRRREIEKYVFIFRRCAQNEKQCDYESNSWSTGNDKRPEVKPVQISDII